MPEDPPQTLKHDERDLRPTPTPSVSSRPNSAKSEDAISEGQDTIIWEEVQAKLKTKVPKEIEAVVAQIKAYSTKKLCKTNDLVWPRKKMKLTIPHFRSNRGSLSRQPINTVASCCFRLHSEAIGLP